MSKKAPPKIPVVYLGCRWNPIINTLEHVFADAKGREARFKGPFKWVWVGHVYEANGPWNKLTMLKHPQEITEKIPKVLVLGEKQIDVHQARDRIALAAQSRFRHNEKMRKNPMSSAFRQELSRKVKDLSHIETEAFIRFLVNEAKKDA